MVRGGFPKELLTMLIMVNLVVIFVGVPANRRRERSRCKSAEVATPARRLRFASPAQARQESRCSDTAASSFAWVGGAEVDEGELLKPTDASQA